MNSRFMGSLLALTATACGGRASPSENGAEAEDASAGDATEESAPMDAGPLLTDATPSASLVFGNAADSGSFLGYFYSTPERTPDGGCISEIYGACTVICSLAPAQLVSAGTLSLSGEAFGTVALQQDESTDAGSYLGVYHQVPLAMQSGDVLSVRGSGDTVPSFPELAITLPQAVALVSPQAGAGGIITVATSEDLQIEWSGGTSGETFVFEVIASLASSGDAGSAASAGNGIYCAFDASAGQGTVPRAAVVAYAGSFGALMIGASTSETFALSSSYAVQITAETIAESGAVVRFQ